MNRLYIIIYILFTCLSPQPVLAARMLTLEETVRLARQQSADAAVALNELKAAYWECRSFRADLLPEVTLGADLPTYNKRYNAYQTDEGSYTYVRSNYLEAGGTLKAVQKIWPTGGTLSLSTSIDFLRQFGTGGEHRFMAVPVGITLQQQLFAANEVKWRRRIEPLRYREAKANFLADTEEVTMRAVTYYFNLLLARENLKTACQNYENAQKLYEVAKVKRQMGSISENDLRQMRLSMLQAESTLTNSQTQLNSSRFRLATYLDLPDSIDIGYEDLAADIRPRPVNYEEALERAMENNPIVLNLERRTLEADYSVATARGNQRSMSLYASVGYTGQGDAMRRAYAPLRDYQTVEVGLSIPLLDWGKRRGRVRVAESNREMVQSLARQERQSFEQNLYILVEELNNQSRQLLIAQESDSIAQRRYETNIATYLAGSISTLELNDAQQSKDQARQRRIEQLHQYWYRYYQLRSITLWDFDRNENINADIEALVKEKE